MRKKDVVLMATVTNFENVPLPSKTDLRQFAELFMPLFNASTDEAKREAIAALSQHPNVPSAVAFFIACQPISLAAPFLIASKCLDDDTLITIARTQGAAHARAIVRREDLSPPSSTRSWACGTSKTSSDRKRKRLPLNRRQR